MYKKQQETSTPTLSREGLCFTYEQVNIVSTFQRLFTELAVLMRATINAYIFNNPNFNEISQSLMKVPSNFRDALLIFYGPEIADRFNSLMTAFVSNMFPILEGFSSNNQELISQSTQKWYSDANNLAIFLDSINLFWTLGQWRYLLNQYIQLKMSMLVALYTGDYERELQIYERVLDLTSIMGAFMAQGLIARDLLRTVQSPATPTTPTTP